MAGESETGVKVHLEMRSFATDLILPRGTHVLHAQESEPLADVTTAVRRALTAPLGTPPLAELCRAAMARAAAAREQPSVVVVVSDSTRPVPYRGEDGILWPLVGSLLDAGFPPTSITLVVATGTHRLLAEEEMWTLFGHRLRAAGIQVHCHDATDPRRTVAVGRTGLGAEVSVNRRYVDAHFRILTGLVEPHLMAGASGGRKSICPGLVDVQTLRDFHGPATLAHERATDLILEGNPCHEVALEIARMVPPDFILNVTTTQDGRPAGVFAGDMEQAHLAAFDEMRQFAEVPLEHEYDLVITHAGKVGVNHYQAEKAAAVAAKAVRPGGYVIVVADTTDPDPVGTPSYRQLLRYLAEVGSDAFVRAILSEDWEFVHDQWGVQTWTKLFARIPPEHVCYFSPQTAIPDYPLLCCADPIPFLSDTLDEPAGEQAARFVARASAWAIEHSEVETGRPAAVAYLADGPHGIPVGPQPLYSGS